MAAKIFLESSRRIDAKAQGCSVRKTLLNMTAFLTALADAGVLPEGKRLIDENNAHRTTPMRPIANRRAPRRSGRPGSERPSRCSVETTSKGLKGQSVADVLNLLERHKISHRFGYANCNDLDDNTHANGRVMPSHQPMRIAPETITIIKRILSPATPKR